MKDGSLQLNGVTLRLRERTLIAPLTLAVAQGEVVTLMGESGVGKSSLLAYLCGMLAPAFTAGGQIVLNGIDLTNMPPEDRHFGILFQDDLLFPHLSVGQNLAFALSPRVASGAERRSQIEDALAEAGLAGFGDRDPYSLSGGQRARVSVMRVLLSEPRALLLDEPFSKLDAGTRQRFRDFVFDHIRRRRLPTLMVTHDPEDAAATGGRVLHLTA